MKFFFHCRCSHLFLGLWSKCAEVFDFSSGIAVMWLTSANFWEAFCGHLHWRQRNFFLLGGPSLPLQIFTMVFALYISFWSCLATNSAELTWTCWSTSGGQWKRLQVRNHLFVAQRSWENSWCCTSKGLDPLTTSSTDSSRQKISKHEEIHEELLLKGFLFCLVQNPLFWPQAEGTQGLSTFLMGFLLIGHFTLTKKYGYHAKSALLCLVAAVKPVNHHKQGVPM